MTISPDSNCFFDHGAPVKLAADIVAELLNRPGCDRNAVTCLRRWTLIRVERTHGVDDSGDSGDAPDNV